MKSAAQNISYNLNQAHHQVCQVGKPCLAKDCLQRFGASRDVALQRPYRDIV